MRAVAERLRRAAAAAAEPRLRDAGNPAPGAARDLEVAAHLQRSVELGIDRERTVTRCQ